MKIIIYLHTILCLYPVIPASSTSTQCCNTLLIHRFVFVHTVYSKWKHHLNISGGFNFWSDAWVRVRDKVKVKVSVKVELWLRVKGLRLDLSWVLLVFIFLYILQLHFFFLYLQHKDMFCHTQKCKFIWINPQLPCVWSDKNIELFDCPYIYCLCILGRNNRQYDLCFLCSSNYRTDRIVFFSV